MGYKVMEKVTGFHASGLGLISELSRSFSILGYKLAGLIQALICVSIEIKSNNNSLLNHLWRSNVSARYVNNKDVGSRYALYI